MKKIILGVCLLFVFTIITSKSFTANELHQLKRLASPVLSNDKKYVVYSIREWDQISGKSKTYLEYTDISTKLTYKLTDTQLGESDNSPQFSEKYPSLVFFLSNRSGSNQLWYINFPPEKDQIPIQLTNYPINIENIKLKANSLVFSSEVYFDCIHNPLTCTADRDKEVKSRGSNTYSVYTKMFVRHWDAWTTENKGNHLFLQTIDSEIKEGNLLPIIKHDVLDLMQGMEANSPVPPFGGSELFDIKYDGSEITFTAHLRNNVESWNTSWKTYYINPSKMNSPVMITEGIEGRTQNPQYSPDGKRISYLVMNRAGLESDNLHLEVYDLLSYRITKVTYFFDRSLIDYIWYDHSSFLFTCTDINKNTIFYVNLEDPNNSITRISNDDFSYNAPLVVDYYSGFLLVQRSSWTQPDQLITVVFDVNQRAIIEMKNLINPNYKNLLEFEFSNAESFFFKGGYEDLVQGWILRPSNFDSNKTYPLAFLIHGGPEGAWESSWSYRWNPQIWSQRGYVVVMINPHGSSGQGIKFQDAVRDDWGGVPYQDLMKGLDYVLEHYKFIDSERMCACGASYGGYMVNWIQGQTDRFKCLVTHDGVFSTLTMFYATEEIWFPYAEYCPRDNTGCNPFDSKYRERYLKFSPETYVQNWKTPHLIIHGSNDFRIPVSEGLSAFTALQVKGIESKFLHFYQENHWVLRPENSIKWYDEVLGWLDYYTNSKEKNQSIKKLEYLEN